MSENLQEIFNECAEKLSGRKEVEKVALFLYAVGKRNAATMLECRKFLGYAADDKKKDAAKAQTFRNKFLHPCRNALTKRTFGITTEEAEQLWAQGGADTEEGAARRKQINSMLPRLTRERSAEIDLGDIFDIEI